MRNYIAFYNKQTYEFEANSLYDAKQKAVQYFKVPKSKQGLLAVMLSDVTHSTSSL